MVVGYGNLDHATSLIQVEVLLVPTGTASNSVALATLIPPFGSVYCAVGAHIDTSECGCPEMSVVVPPAHLFIRFYPCLISRTDKNDRECG